MANLSGKMSEVKVSRADARFCGRGAWLAYAVRAYNRAVRREGRALSRAYQPEARVSRINFAGYRASGGGDTYENKKIVVDFGRYNSGSPCACGGAGPGMRCAYCEW